MFDQFWIIYTIIPCLCRKCKTAETYFCIYFSRCKVTVPPCLPTSPIHSVDTNVIIDNCINEHTIRPDSLPSFTSVNSRTQVIRFAAEKTVKLHRWGNCCGSGSTMQCGRSTYTGAYPAVQWHIPWVPFWWLWRLRISVLGVSGAGESGIHTGTPWFWLEKSYDSGVKFSDPVFIPENAGHLEIEKRTRYPMFDLDHYLSTLILHRINVYDDGDFSFIISDQMDYLCKLYGVVTTELKFIDWNNG